MAFKWFKKWNDDNPIDWERPVFVMGAGGVGVFAVIALAVWGQPFATDSLQTGPRGNGMVQTDTVTQLSTPDPDIARYEATLSDDNIVRAMQEWTGIPDLFENLDSYQTQVGYLMIGMTQTINENWGDHVSAYGENGVTCFTCHRGEPVPKGIWFDMTPVNHSMAGWAATQNRATAISSSTSLPVDALKAYLVDREPISVHSFSALEPGVPGRDVPSIQDAERTYSLMNYIDNSLGVNCTFCHNTRAFYDASQVTPQWFNASLGIAMVQELNNDFMAGVAYSLPPERLGPVNGDGPKLACMTCHQGEQRPLQGTNVIQHWPQLAIIGEPVVE